MEYDTYVVTRGDTLSKIAQAHGTDPDQLANLNGIREPNFIYPGQKLRIPKKPRLKLMAMTSIANCGFGLLMRLANPSPIWQRELLPQAANTISPRTTWVLSHLSRRRKRAMIRMSMSQRWRVEKRRLRRSRLTPAFTSTPCGVQRLRSASRFVSMTACRIMIQANPSSWGRVKFSITATSTVIRS